MNEPTSSEGFRQPPCKYPDPETWTFENGVTVELFSYHHIRQWEQDRFIRACDKGFGKRSNIAGAI